MFLFSFTEIEREQKEKELKEKEEREREEREREEREREEREREVREREERERLERERQERELREREAREMAESLAQQTEKLSLHEPNDLLFDDDLQSPPTDIIPAPTWQEQESMPFQGETDLEQKEREIIEKLERDELEKQRQEVNQRPHLSNQSQVSATGDDQRGEDQSSEEPDVDHQSFDLTSSTVEDLFKELANHNKTSSFEERVSQEVESVLESRPPLVAKVSRHSWEEENRRLMEWAKEQEKCIQERFIQVFQRVMPPSMCMQSAPNAILENLHAFSHKFVWSHFALLPLPFDSSCTTQRIIPSIGLTVRVMNN